MLRSREGGGRRRYYHVEAEWRPAENGPTSGTSSPPPLPPTATTVPFVYEVDGGKPFAIAGLWEWWGGPEGKNEPLESCSIITTDANKLASEIHDRMPVILDEKDYDPWLSCGEVPLVPFAAKRMKARPVSRYSARCPWLSLTPGSSANLRS